LHLRSSAHIELNSLSYKILGTDKVDGSAPLAGYVDKMKAGAKQGASKAWKAVKAASWQKEVVVGVLAAIGLGAVITGGAAAYGSGKLAGDNSISSRWDSTKVKNQAALDVLKEL
jgi:hypothetical protein